MRAALLVLALAACGGDGAPASPDAGPADARVAPPDARLAPCGIEEPGSRCLDPTSIERCQGTDVVSDGCDAGVCGIDPTVGAGVTCLSLPASCGKVTNAGACSGSILTRCFRSELTVIDCAAAFTDCRVDVAGGARCTTDCQEQSVNAQGACAPGGAGIKRCVFADGRYRVETSACPAGTTCTPTGPESGYPTCVPPCGLVGAGGTCAGDVLRRCAGTALEEIDCAARGQVCAFSGDAYGCAPAGTGGALRVAGTVRYERREADLAEEGPVRPAPARGATVAVIADSDGRLLASAGVADDGSYQLRYDGTAGASVHLLAVSAATGKLRPVRVIRPDGLLHGFAGASFAAGPDGAVDLLATERSGTAGAFAILDALARGLDTVRKLLDVGEPVPFVAIWARGHETITAEDNAVIWIGGTFDDDDSFDDPVILHELGHYVEEVYGKTDTPGGRHELYAPSVPTLAWSEGWATYWSSVVRDDPIYSDSRLLGGFDFSIELDQTLADPRKSVRQDLPENTVSEILWDLGDDGAHDDDPAEGDHKDVVRVQTRYFRGSVDRGYPGVDLVDFLDGFLALAGAGRCSSTRAVVASRGFPYDFAGPVACPAP